MTSRLDLGPRPNAPLSTLLLLTILAAGCGDDATSGDDSGPGTGASQAVEELIETGFAKYLGAQPPSRTEEDGDWTHYFFDPAEEGAICLVGDEFQISVKDGPSDQVLFYLQGGGACWDYVTCHVVNTALRTANGPVPSGIIDPDDPRNPFADWDVVYVPYCDGSVFTGDAIVDYDGVQTYHHGLRNLSVAVDALTSRFPNPSRVVVAGSSAGGYGTYSGYGAVRVALPETPILVFNDSGPGVQNFDASDDVQNRVANWNFTDLIPASCTRCNEQYSYLTGWALDRDPWLRTALYSYQQDGVISFFIDLDGPAYRDLILDVTGHLEAEYPNRFERFFPLGTEHTVLLSGTFYEQTIRETSLLDWTRAFLDDPEGWADVIE